MHGHGHTGSVGCDDSISIPQEGHWSGRAVLCPDHTAWTCSGLRVLDFAAAHWRQGVRGEGGPVFLHFPTSSTELHNINLWTFGVFEGRDLVRSLWTAGKGRAECQREEVVGGG